MRIPSRYYPPKGITREAKRKRDRLYDRQIQEFSLTAAQYHWTKWGSDEIEYMRQCAKEGKTRNEVALDLGRTFYSVSTKARREKIRFVGPEQLVTATIFKRSEAER